MNSGEDGQSSGPRAGRRVIDAGHWQHRLDVLADRYRVPGATLGVLRVDGGTAPDERVTLATGVLDCATGVPTTPDSLFQIGSITKVWTATLVMQLVDEGALTLGTPLRTVLPELRLADTSTARQVTMWHLLTHSNGVDGDYMIDTGDGDNCLERFITELRHATVIHPLGAMFSYANAGFSLAGRVVEKLTGVTWDTAIGTRLAGPLQLRNTVTRPGETTPPHAAVGHYVSPGRPPTPVSIRRLSRSWGPAGTITADVDDVLTFAGLHLRGGTTAHGHRLLSESSIATMRRHHVDLPASGDTADAWGAGWARMNWDGMRLIGHDGATIGQTAYLRLLPAEGLAVALLTNSGDTAGFSHDLLSEVFTELAGVCVPAPPEPSGGPPSPDAAAHVGTYRRTGEVVDITQREGGRLALRSTRTDGFERFSDTRVTEFDLEHVRDDLFVARPPGSALWQPVVFCRLPSGERYLYRRSRALPMTTSTAT